MQLFESWFQTCRKSAVPWPKSNAAVQVRSTLVFMFVRQAKKKLEKLLFYVGFFFKKILVFSNGQVTILFYEHNIRKCICIKEPNQSKCSMKIGLS